MDINIKTKLKNMVDEYIINRKAMFIPIAAVASFMLVGYAAADKEKPEIKSKQIEIPFGEKFDLASIDISDNKDSRELIDVKADTSSLNVNQLGTYDVEVVAIDQGANEAKKKLRLLLLITKNLNLKCLGQAVGILLKYL